MKYLKWMFKEPALITALINEIVIMVTLFGAQLTHEQMAGIMGVSTAALALLTRSFSYPVVSREGESK